MNKAILMSIQSKWLVKILNGDKTLELRKSAPKDFTGWVYIYVIKRKRGLILHDFDKVWRIGNCVGSNENKLVNGLVVARFWFDEYDKITNGGSRFYVNNKDIGYTNLLAKKSCLDFTDLKKYAGDKDVYAWHIKQLEIFDKPFELREFSIFKRETISCGMDCPPYMDWVEYSVHKAPQSWQYAWLWE